MELKGMDEPVDESQGQQLRGEVSLPVDAHGYLRASCPVCGLECKLDVSEQLLHDVLGSAVRRFVNATGVFRVADGAPSRPDTKCPYCDHVGDTQDFLHEDHVFYLRAVVQREIVEPLLCKMFEESFGSFRNSKYVQVNYSRGHRSTRPLVGPESTDLVRVRCLGCEAGFKVLAGWRGTVNCPACSLALVAT